MNLRHLVAAVAIAASAPTVALAAPAEAAPAPAAYAACGPVTYTWGTKYPGCDLEQPDVLNVYGLSYSTCLNWGGRWGGYVKLKTGYLTTICYDVDY